MQRARLSDHTKRYGRLRRDDSAAEARLDERFESLLGAARETPSALTRDFKPLVALALKWKFDYLAKRLDSPFELERDLDYWIDAFRMLRVLAEQRWFQLSEDRPGMDVWKRTARAPISTSSSAGSSRCSVAR